MVSRPAVAVLLSMLIFMRRRWPARAAEGSSTPLIRASGPSARPLSATTSIGTPRADGELRGLCGIARVLAAIGEQHQALVALVRQQRQRQPHRALDIRRAAAGQRGHLAERAVARRHALDQRALPEHDQRGLVVVRHLRQRLLHKRLGAGALRKRDRNLSHRAGTRL